MMLGEKRETTTRAALRDPWNSPRTSDSYIVRRLNGLHHPTGISGNPYSGNGHSYGRS